MQTQASLAPFCSPSRYLRKLYFYMIFLSSLTSTGGIVLLVAYGLFGLGIGIVIGLQQRGKMLSQKSANQLPFDRVFLVISKDSKSAVLEDVTEGKTRRLVSSEMFHQKNIRPGDHVHLLRKNDDIKRLNIPKELLGGPILIKCEKTKLKVA